MYYSKNKLNSLYGNDINILIGKKGLGRSYYEELKSKKNKCKLIRRQKLKRSQYVFNNNI